MRIAVASDHAGFELKANLKQYLAQKGYEIFDAGPLSAERSDYPDFAKIVAKDVQAGKSKFGVLVCGSGIGMCITANRFKGVRAVVLHDVTEAELSRKHNDANVACFGARFADFDTAKNMIDAFLAAPFEGGRHEARVKKID